ncbi:MAG: insulinase family protein, partial [Simkaniaceae bacterium]|nr:insulinase family protein [Simkaniaceae bacterium]
EKTIHPTLYSKELLKELLDYLTPKQCLFTVMAPPELTGVTPNTQEKWLGGEYAMQKIPLEELTAWKEAAPHKNFAPPSQNPFIPKSIKVSETPYNSDHKINEPFLIENSLLGKGYYWTDTEYLLPEVSYILSIKSPEINGSARKSVLLDLLLKSIKTKLTSIASQASRAGIYPQIYQDDLKFNIEVNGFSEKSSELLEEIFHTIKTISPTKAEFQLYKEMFLSKYENQEKKSLPFYQAIEITSNLLENDSPLSAELQSELKEITYEEFIAFIDTIFQQTYLEMMLTGALDESTAKHIWNRFKEHFASIHYPINEQHKKELLILPQNQGPFMVTDFTNMQGHAAILTIEQGPFSFEKKAAQNLLNTALKTSFFETLRTKQQTAYIARAWATEIEHELLQYFAVQSSTHQPEELIARFELFIEDFLKNFEVNLPLDRFEKMKEMAIVSYSTPPTNLEEMASRLSRLAFTHQGDFSRVDKLIESLKNLSYQDLEKASKEFLSRKNTKRLAVLLVGAS